MLSILTPAFNEAANLDALHARIVATMEGLGLDWEWVVVDDHSRDETFATIERLARADARVRGLRLARNSGSHAAIACGLHHVRGEVTVMMAGDLQDPPETVAAMLECWRQGAHVVWAARRVRPGDRTHAGFAALYYWIMRRVVGMREMPARGADFFLADQTVVAAFRRFPERQVSVFALLTQLGFRQATIEYDKRPRTAGRSGLTLSRKVLLVLDSVTAFSAVPIRLLSALGLLLVTGAVIAAVALALGSRAPTPLSIAVTVMVGVGGIQLVGLGILGEYLWRTLEESRRRPAFVIEAVTGSPLPTCDKIGSC
jgi:glycosyltransferase involved in cell wall biosynthesis